MPRNYSRAIDVVARPDVLVCGAGCAGIGAAVAAARTGARTMVVDRMGFAAYRITMITLASTVIIALFMTLVPLVGER